MRNADGGQKTQSGEVPNQSGVRRQRLILIRISEATPEPWQALFRSAVALPESLSRALWRTKKHRERFPEAKRYAPSFEEEQDVLQVALTTWEKEKAKKPLHIASYLRFGTCGASGRIPHRVHLVRQPRKVG